MGKPFAFRKLVTLKNTATLTLENKDSNDNSTQPAGSAHAMIFSAGLGTRFKPWTDTHPKALAIVNGKTLLQRNIEYLAANGYHDVIVNVHHFAGQIKNAVIENNGWGSNVIISDETNEVLETGGGLLRAKPFFTPGESFITCNVDVLTDMDIRKLISFHQHEKALISFGVTNRKTSRYLLFDEYNRLWGWRNENTGEEKGPHLEWSEGKKAKLIPKAYSCVVVFDYSVFSLIKQQGKFSLMDVYLDLAKDHRIMGFDHRGDKWVDVGRPESVAVAEEMFGD